MNFLYVFLGGGIGSVARYLLSMSLNRGAVGSFPFGTFVANIAGCLLIGFLYGASARLNIPDNMRLMLTVGVCGGFTTFSTFSSESLGLVRNGFYGIAAFYIFGSLLLGIIAAFAGGYVGKSI